MVMMEVYRFRFYRLNKMYFLGSSRMVTAVPFDLICWSRLEYYEIRYCTPPRDLLSKVYQINDFVAF